MSPLLYTVTLTDLGTYEVTVAADSPKQAASIAEGILRDEATQIPTGMRVVERKTEAEAVPSVSQPLQIWRVPATYSIDVELRVPASSREEAEAHAKRIYAETPYPWEHDSTDERVTWYSAREVQS